jgi:hypothetical protein
LSSTGHIYRGFMPYGFGKLSGKGPIVSLNLKRVAEVWMDEYKEYYYIRVRQSRLFFEMVSTVQAMFVKKITGAVGTRLGGRRCL